MSKHVKEGDIHILELVACICGSLKYAIVVHDGLVRILLSECFLVEPFYNSIIVATHIYLGPFCGT